MNSRAAGLLVAAKPAAAPVAAAATPAAPKRKLSFKVQRELELLRQKIETLEKDF